MVNLNDIKTLKPCQSRLDNYVKFYGDKSFRKTQFMGLKNITQEDKVWVAFRLMPKDSIRLAAADIAELVLHFYESKYPNDMRPRNAIAAARSGDRNAAADAYAADAAAADAYAAAAYAAADADAYAAADAVAYAAAYAARKSGNLGYEKQIRKILLKYWK